MNRLWLSNGALVKCANGKLRMAEECPCVTPQPISVCTFFFVICGIDHAITLDGGTATYVIEWTLPDHPAITNIRVWYDNPAFIEDAGPGYYHPEDVRAAVTDETLSFELHESQNRLEITHVVPPGNDDWLPWRVYLYMEVTADPYQMSVSSLGQWEIHENTEERVLDNIENEPIGVFVYDSEFDYLAWQAPPYVQDIDCSTSCTMTIAVDGVDEGRSDIDKETLHVFTITVDGRDLALLKSFDLETDFTINHYDGNDARITRTGGGFVVSFNNKGSDSDDTYDFTVTLEFRGNMVTGSSVSVSHSYSVKGGGSISGSPYTVTYSGNCRTAADAGRGGISEEFE